MKTSIEIALCDVLNCAVLAHISYLCIDWEDCLVVVDRSFTDLYYDNKSKIDRLDHVTMQWKNVQ